MDRSDGNTCVTITPRECGHRLLMKPADALLDSFVTGHAVRAVHMADVLPRAVGG
jgi:hypothetical protein